LFAIILSERKEKIGEREGEGEGERGRVRKRKRKTEYNCQQSL
jgi:hypothetical protein